MFLTAHPHYTSVSDSWVMLFDRYGRILFVLVAGAILVLEVLSFGSDRFYSILLSGCAALIGTTLLNAVLKALVRKERRKVKVQPLRHPLGVLVRYSFPSFHSQVAFTMTALASWFAWRLHWSVPVLLYVLAVLTAVSRKVIKAHDWNDLICGAVIGTVAAAPFYLFLGDVHWPALSIVVFVAAAVLLLWIPHRDFA